MTTQKKRDKAAPSGQPGTGNQTSQADRSGQPCQADHAASRRTEEAQDVSMEALFLSEMDMGRIMDGLFQGAEPASMLGWKPEETENFYVLAYRHYVAGDVDGARPLFQMLCKLKPNDVRFWMGYGGCLQGSGSYLEAIDAYSMACVSERFGSPVPFLYVATCFVLLKEKKKACTVLDALLVMGDANNPTHAACHEKARNMLHMLDA